MRCYKKKDIYLHRIVIFCAKCNQTSVVIRELFHMKSYYDHNIPGLYKCSFCYNGKLNICKSHENIGKKPRNISRY